MCRLLLQRWSGSTSRDGIVPAAVLLFSSERRTDSLSSSSEWRRAPCFQPEKIALPASSIRDFSGQLSLPSAYVASALACLRRASALACLTSNSSVSVSGTGASPLLPSRTVANLQLRELLRFQSDRSISSKMDVKALARSKRSHTKHHQPRKPHRPAAQSTTSSSSSKDPKALNKEGGKKRSNPGTSLPSNLARYYDSDEEHGLFGSDSDASKTDVVKPKSKGADFGFLISEALSQSPANFADAFDSFCPDFSEGRGSMLSIFGENILSWTGGDDFLMEDGRPINQEVSFLSLDLQTLSKDFARITHSRRLFIEEDILPAEMSSEAGGVIPGSSKVEREMLSGGQSLQSDRQEKQSADSVGAQKSDSFGILDTKKPFKSGQEEAELDNKMLRFEAKAAEAELDTLLHSLNEADFFDSPRNMGSNVSSEATTTLVPASNMENDIDDLLEETTNLALTEANAADPMAKQLSFGPSTGSKSLVMEDFDSWLDTLP